MSGIDTDNLFEFDGEYVNVVYTEDGTQYTADGTVIKANSMAVLVRPKNRRTIFIAADDLITITKVNNPNSTPRIKMRYIEPVTEETVRQHLADRHGLPISEIPVDPANALMVHSGINHDDLGHKHEAKPARAQIGPESAAARAAAIDGVDGADSDIVAEGDYIEEDGDDEA